MRILFILSLTAVLGLSACMDRGEYPSLKPRAFETAGHRMAQPPAPSPSPASPEVVARAAAFVARAETGQRAFAAELGSARPIIARAGAPDSESWITAQEHLSGLDTSRVETVNAMAALDALTLAGVDGAGRSYGEADLATIRTAGERIAGLLEAQQRDLDTLARSIPAL